MIKNSLVPPVLRKGEKDPVKSDFVSSHADHTSGSMILVIQQGGSLCFGDEGFAAGVSEGSLGGMHFGQFPTITRRPVAF